jgi:uncharacterized YigZ family protein
MEIKSYRSAAQAAVYEYTVSRSKFIAHVYPVDSPGAAEERLAALKAAHPFATHICYAYRTDAADGTQTSPGADGLRGGGVQKASDAGEPKGTAGLPILEAVKNGGLTRVLVAVVRYFGGVKLGTGGLARAYGRAASGALKAAGVAEYRLMTVLEIDSDFSAAARIRGLKNGVEIRRTFGESVTLTLASAEPERLRAEVDGLLQRKGAYRVAGEEWVGGEGVEN